MTMLRKLSLAFLEEYPAEGAAVLEGLTDGQAVSLLYELPVSVASDLLRWSTPHFATSVLEACPPARAFTQMRPSTPSASARSAH